MVLSRYALQEAINLGKPCQKNPAGVALAGSQALLFERRRLRKRSGAGTMAGNLMRQDNGNLNCQDNVEVFCAILDKGLGAARPSAANGAAA
jgi:hypothetical protein